MWRPRTTAILATLLLLTTVLTPVATAETPLAIDVEQGDLGSPTVTVTHNGTAVENATVTVDAPNATYAGEGAHETDANGTVELPAPEEDVTVDVTAANESQTSSTTVELQAPSLDVAVEQAADGNATATVTYAITGGPAEGATVNVTTADENETYAATGEHVTGDNGTVDLPAPDGDVSVELVAEAENVTGSATAALEAPDLDVAVEQDDDGNATATVTYGITGGPVEDATLTVATVDDNESYAGEGEHATDENGTVDLPAPEEDVAVEVIAAYGDLSGSTTVELEAATGEADDGDSFGATVSAFVHSLLSDRGDGHPGIGRSVASWVLGHNPGEPPAHAGPPPHAGPADGDQGPPAFAGAGADAPGNASVTADEDESGGPPAHAGPPDGDRGNGEAKGR